MDVSSLRSKKATAAGVAFVLALTLGINFAPSQAASRNLIYGSAAGIPQLNPIILTSATEMPLTTLLWAGLTSRNESGGVDPDLATRWNANASATQWTFTLRQGAKFSDGSPLTSKAVKAAYEYFQKQPQIFELSRSAKLIISIKIHPHQDHTKLLNSHQTFH